MICNTAVFYDIENMICLLTAKSSTILRLDEIYRRILEVEGVNGVSVQKAYADWAILSNRNLRGYVLQIGIEPVQIFNTNQNDRVKNAADVSLIIDAVELLTKRPEVENYVIVSGDGIFAFLAKKLHEYGKRVIGCGFSRNTNIIFNNACDYFISLEKSDKTLLATSRHSPLSSLPAMEPDEDESEIAEIMEEKPAPPPAAVKKQNNNKKNNHFPRNRFTDALANYDIPVWRNGNDANGALLVVRDLINALFSPPVSNEDALEISIFKTYLDYFVPQFKIGQYRFKRFSEFIRFLVSNSPYVLFSSDGTTLKVARRGAAAINGEITLDLPNLEIIMPNNVISNTIFDVPEGVPFTYTLTPAAAKKQPAKPTANKPPAAPSATVPAALTAQIAQTPVLAAQTANNPAAAVSAMAEQQTAAAEAFNVLTAPARAAASETAMEITTVSPPLSAASNDDRPTPALPEKPAQEPPAIKTPDDMVIDGSIRKWVKNTFTRLSEENTLSAAEIELLMTVPYSVKTFGVRSPIFKEIASHVGLEEKRMVNGKVKYWKDFFKFNNKTYIIYKEWSDHHHRERFIQWLNSVILP